MINGFSELIKATQKHGKNWEIVGDPYPIQDCTDDTLNSFIDTHTSEDGVYTWSSIKQRKTVFNAKSSKIKVLFHGYCKRCNEFFKSSSSCSSNQNFKSQCVQKKIMINGDRSHLAIYITNGTKCKRASIPSNYLPKRGFTTNDNVRINQALRGGSTNGNLIAHELTQKGIPRVEVNKRLSNRKSALKIKPGVHNGYSLSSIIDIFTEATFTYKDVVLNQQPHPFHDNESHPLHGLYVIDSDFQNGSNWSYVMLLLNIAYT